MTDDFVDIRLFKSFTAILFNTDVYMTTEKPSAGKKSLFCSFCDRTGIVYNPESVLGEEPLIPCPKCVLPSCRCGGISPYYYMENGHIKDCSCRTVRLRIDRIKELYQNSGIEKKFRWRFIGDFRSLNQSAAAARSAAYDMISRFPDVSRGLYLWGNPGTGKTMLSAIILTELIVRNALPGKFIKISRTFFSRLKETFNPASPLYGKSGEIERELQNTDVLVLDDFGVQRDTEWEQETLYNLVDARYENEKFTIFTSNNDPFKELQNLSQGRVLSRLKEMCRIMELSGEDLRGRGNG